MVYGDMIGTAAAAPLMKHNGTIISGPKATRSRAAAPAQTAAQKPASPRRKRTPKKK
jgi:hypothetical protein